MKKRKQITVDANEAVAMVAHCVNEVIAIYPISPFERADYLGILQSYRPDISR